MRWIRFTIVAVLALGATYWWMRPADISDRRTDTVYASEKARPITVAARGKIEPVINIEAAYRAIPHVRTVFLPQQAKMSREESSYLSALFTLTDAAVAERVYLQDRLRRGHKIDIARTNYPAILTAVRSLPTPAGLLPVENLIQDALEEQHDYFEQWSKSGDPKFFSSRAPLVQTSHSKLIAAYFGLKRRYGGEPAQNMQAFYDYLCALDFV